MPSKAVALIIEKTEAITGYKVTVSKQENLQTSASMIPARSENPYHIILINPKYEKASNYLVAIQCLMLLEKRDEDGNIYDFAIRDATVERLGRKAAKSIKAQ